MKRLKRICDEGYISVMDFINNPLRIFAAHELGAIIDPATTVKVSNFIYKLRRHSLIFPLSYR